MARSKGKAKGGGNSNPSNSKGSNSNNNKSPPKKTADVAIASELSNPTGLNGDIPTTKKNDNKQHTPSFLPPFLLGFSLALILILVPVLSAVYWGCKDVDWNPLTSATECPRIIIADSDGGQEKQKGLFRRGKKKKNTNDDIVLELPPPPTPTECSCRLLGSIWHSIFRKPGGVETTTQQQQQKLPMTCIPKTAGSSSLELSKGEDKPRDTELVERYKSAFTSEAMKVSSKEQSLIEGLHTRVEEYIPDFKDRVSKVRWGQGGSGTVGYDWFALPSTKSNPPTDLNSLTGGRLYYSYLRIMKWPTDLKATFPFKLCGKGCNSEEAVRHTLEFREKYKPWLITATVKKENSKGSIFVHGFSHPNEEGEGAHSLVWVRPGQRTKVDDMANTRAYINTIEMAVTKSMKNSNGRIGKFNAIIDGSNFSWGLFPARHQLFAFVLMLQDHFPDRLGMLFLTNLGRIGELVVKLVLPLLSEEVRAKIHVLPHDPLKRRAALEAVMPAKYIPDWLGGSDSFVFDVNEYYKDSVVITDEEAKKYVTTMPYHA